MTSPAAGQRRILALAAVILLALNLRTAVTTLSPIFAQIEVDIPIDSLGIGLLGALAPLSYAVAGLITPRLRRLLGLEQLILITIVLIMAGHLLHAVAPDFPLLVVGSLLAFGGMGITNVLLPPIIKKYFPERIGALTSTYIAVSTISTLLPPLVAVPLAISAGWRFSVGVWVLLGIGALIPWIALYLRHRRLEPEEHVPALPVWRLRMSWAFAFSLGLSSLNVFAIFAWLPEILIDLVHSTPAEAGAYLAAYTAIGLVIGSAIPLVGARMRDTTTLPFVSFGLFLVSYIGLLVAPGTLTLLWLLVLGVAPLLFPLSLTLINMRTRSWAGATSLSGFAQGVGYLIAGTGPLIVGLLHQLSDGWTVPLVFLLCTTGVLFVAGLAMTRSGMLEDDMERR